MMNKQFEQGVAYYRSNNYSQALQLLLPLVQVVDDRNVLYVVSQSFRRIGEFSKSEYFFKKLISKHAHPAFYCAYAGLLNDVGKIDDAISHFNKALDIDANYFDAHYNKALIFLNNNLFEEAILSFNFSRMISDVHVGAIIGLGQSYAAAGRVGEAIAIYEKYVTKDENTSVMYQLALLYLKINDRDKAEKFLKICAERHPDNKIFNLAYIDLLELQLCTETALQYCKVLLKCCPFDIDVHNRIFNILWNCHSNEIFAEYQVAYKNNPLDVLTLEYVHKLIKVDDLISAKEVLEYYTFHIFDDRAVVMLAHVLRELGEFERSLAILDKLDIDKINIDATYERVITLLCLKDYSQALTWAHLLYSQPKSTQSSIALYATVLRISNRLQEYNDIFNYKDCIGVFDLVGEFNVDLHAQLASDVSKLHSASKHPINQSLRTGTQTNGELFNLEIKSISDFKVRVKNIIENFINSMPDILFQRFFSSKPVSINFSGSWSVKLGMSGFHLNHYHNSGVFSACYYLTTSGVTNDGRGWLQFGQPELSRWLKLESEFVVKPEIGKLVIFPSYMWHGTTPKANNGERMTIAFDIQPKA